MTSQGRTLWGIAGLTDVISSVDGGKTWRAPVRLPPVLPKPLISGNSSVLAVIDAGDTGTSLPRTIARSVDGGATWAIVKPPQLQRAIAAWTVVEPSGRLLVYVVNSLLPNPSLPTGLYKSDDVSWGHFHEVTTPPLLHGADYSPNDGGWLVAAPMDTQGSAVALPDRWWLPRGHSQRGPDVRGRGSHWTVTRYR